MVNRLVFERREGGWAYEGEPLDGDLGSLSTASPVVLERPRSGAVNLLPSGEAAPADTVSFPATVVDSEFGGRYMDVSIETGLTRLQARIPAGERGGWARSLNAGQPVVATV